MGLPVREDTSIDVHLTPDDVPECIEVIVVGVVTLRMHTLSAIDLHRKLGNAIAEWFSEQAAAYLADDFAIGSKR